MYIHSAHLMPEAVGSPAPDSTPVATCDGNEGRVVMMIVDPRETSRVNPRLTRSPPVESSSTPLSRVNLGLA